MHWLEYARDLEKRCRFLLLLYRAANMVHRFLTNAPLYPSRLPMRRFHRPTLLETWSRKGLMVNAMRTRGREPLRSASRLLGSAINLCFWDPGHRLGASPSCGLLRLCQEPFSYPTAPSSFWRRHLVCISVHRAPVAARNFCLAVAFTEGPGGECRSGGGPGHFAGNPLHRISADTSISNAGRVAPFTSEV